MNERWETILSLSLKQYETVGQHLERCEEKSIDSTDMNEQVALDRFDRSPNKELKRFSALEQRIEKTITVVVVPLVARVSRSYVVQIWFRSPVSRVLAEICASQGETLTASGVSVEKIRCFRARVRFPRWYFSSINRIPYAEIGRKRKTKRKVAGRIGARFTRLPCYDLATLLFVSLLWFPFYFSSSPFFFFSQFGCWFICFFFVFVSFVLDSSRLQPSGAIVSEISPHARKLLFCVKKTFI